MKENRYVDNDEEEVEEDEGREEKVSLRRIR